VLMEKGTPSNMLVPAYSDMLLAAIRERDPAVVSVEISEQWQRVKVHSVPIKRYMNSMHGLELAREEIELGTPIKLKRDPTWLKSMRVLQTGKQQFATMVVTVGSREEARTLLKAGLKFGGHHYKTEAYWDANPGSVCTRCCGIGHSGYRACKERPPRCTICAGDHEVLSHQCNVIGCGAGLARPCQHTVTRCTNCGASHEATSPKCPKVRQARKQAIQQARNRALQHLVPPSQGFAVVVSKPPKPLGHREELVSTIREPQGSLSTNQPDMDEGTDYTTPLPPLPDTGTPSNQESC
jgi:hypothetical protein